MTAVRELRAGSRRDPDRAFFGHPAGLGYLTFTEAWERFSFSGMQTLLVLYMFDELLKPGHVEHVLGFAALKGALQSVYGPLTAQPLSSAVFGLYTSLIFLTPILGGYFGDRRVGQHRMVMTGAVLMALGHFLMSFEADFLLALLLLVLGAGCLKGNISTQVGGLYADEDRRRTNAFQIFSAGTNVGVIAAPLVCGTLGELYGYRFGFAAAGVGMLISLGVYMAGRRALPADRMTAARVRGPATPRDPRMFALLALVFVLVTCFLVTGGQLGNVYNLWLKTHVDRRAFGLVIPVTWFQTLTPLFSALLTPAVLVFWRWLADRALEPPLTVKMAIGLALAGLSLLALSLVSRLGGRIGWVWLLPTHILICVAFLFTWPVGLALFSRAAPQGGRAMFIGVFFITSFFGGNLVGWIGGLYQAMTPSAFWVLQAAIGGGGALLALAFGPSLERALARAETAGV